MRDAREGSSTAQGIHIRRVALPWRSSTLLRYSVHAQTNLGSIGKIGTAGSVVVIPLICSIVRGDVDDALNRAELSSMLKLELGLSSSDLPR